MTEEAGSELYIDSEMLDHSENSNIQASQRSGMSAHVSNSIHNNQDAPHIAPGGIYGEDDSEEEMVDQQRDAEEIKPSKSKFDKFVEEVKTREINAEQRIFADIKVDQFCDIERVKVYQDYSA